MQDGLVLTIHSMQRVAKYLLTARKALSNEKYTSDILLQLVTVNGGYQNYIYHREIPSKQILGEA